MLRINTNFPLYSKRGNPVIKSFNGFSLMNEVSWVELWLETDASTKGRQLLTV